MIFIAVIAVLFIIIALFAFPKFSPIPYFPSNIKDMNIILKALRIGNNQTVFDLGAGDGTVIFKAAGLAFGKKLNTRFIAIDINPILVGIMQLRRLFHPNKKNIQVIRGDIFTINYHKLLTFTRLAEAKSDLAEASAKRDFSLLTFYLYISPWYLEKTLKNIKKQTDNFRIVSYMYKIKSLEKFEKRITGKIHDIFIYNI